MRTGVDYSIEREVGIITFKPEQPQKPPALDHEFLDDLEEVIGRIRVSCSPAAHESGPGQVASVGVRAVVICSASPKYFLVGANLEALERIDRDSIVTWVERGHEVFNRLTDLSVPVIARVTGSCLGGGLELAMACDFILASENASFGQPEASMGFVPGWGGCSRLPLYVGLPRARELMATGRILDAREARAMGLVAFAGTESELDTYLQQTLASIKRNSSLAIAMSKKIANSLWDRRAASVLLESLASRVCLASGDAAQRLDEFFGSRERRGQEKP